MAAALPWVKPQFTDASGNPLVGGKVWFYQAGTSIPIASFTDSTGTVPNTNPVILDGSGRGDIWLAPGSYKVVLKDANDVVIWTKDKVKPADGGGGGILDADYTYQGYSARFSEYFESVGLSDTLTKILNFMYIGPAISLAASGSTTIREKGTSVASTTLTATVTKKSDPIANVKFYQGATLLSTKTSTIPTGGVETQVYSTPFTDNVSFSATTTDDGTSGGPTTVTAGVSFTFVYPYYSGVGAAALTGAQIGALTKDVRVSTPTLLKSFSPNGSQKMYFAYPSSYGALVSILDGNGFETIADWTLSTKSITGLDASSQSYYCYEFNNTAVVGSYDYTFKR